MNDHADLLAPSLQDKVVQPIFSVGALIAAAFFGGGFAVPLLAAANSRRLGRLSRDAVWLALGIVIAAAGILVAVVYFGDLGDTVGREVRLANRGIGFALVGGAYLLHRHPYRASTAMGIKPPSPYLAVVTAVVVGSLMSMALFLAFSAPGLES